MYSNLVESRRIKVESSNLLTFARLLLTINLYPLAVNKGWYFSNACSNTRTASSIVP